MDWDDIRPKPKPAMTLGEPLAALGVAELEARIGALRQEIASVPFAKFATTRGNHRANFANDKDTSKALILV